MGEILGVGIIGAVWIVVYLAMLYVIVFYIALPALNIAAKMFGFPGLG